jgi:Glycosyl transferase family 2
MIERAPEFESASPERRTGMLHAIADQAATTHFAAQRHSAGWMPRYDFVIPELRAAALMMMVKDECDIIRHNLEHHYGLGFRRFFIIDNGSTDGTSGLIEAFRALHRDALVVCLFDPLVGYYQQTKQNAFQIFAHSYLSHEDPPLDWIFTVDADEFITCCAADAAGAGTAFRAALADRHRKLMIFHWVQCTSDEIIETLNSPEPPLEIYRHHWHKLAPAVPKVAFRAHHDIMTIQGNHAAERYPFSIDQAVVMAEAGFYLLHYPMRSIEQMRKKFANGGRAYEMTKGLACLGTNWKLTYRAMLEHGDTVLRQKFRNHIARGEPVQSMPGE